MRLTTGWYRSIVVTTFGVLLCGPILASSQKKGSSCPTPAPHNPTLNACFSSMAQSGCIDSYFGSAGEVTFLDTGLAPQGAVRLQPPPQSGGTPKIIVFNQTGSSATVMRLNLDGTMDSTFGTNGVSSYQLGTGLIGVYDGLIDANRNIIVGGYAGSDLFVMRFRPDGGVDTTFGSNGVFMSQGGLSGSAMGKALALQPDGKIIAVGAQ